MYGMEFGMVRYTPQYGMEFGMVRYTPLFNHYKAFFFTVFYGIVDIVI